MKLSSQLTKLNILSQKIANKIGFSVILALLLLSGCKEITTETTSDVAVVEEKPEGYGLVSFYYADSLWQKTPEDIPPFNSPGLDIDKNDHVWYLQRQVPILQEYAPTGEFIQAWGTLGDSITNVDNGPVDLTFAMKNPQIHNVKVDHEGNVWIAAWRLGVVYKCSPDGKVLMVLGTYNEIGEDETHFGEPTDMAISPVDGDIFVADGEKNFRIVHFDKDGNFIKAWGKQGKGPGEFEVPHSITMDSKGLLYVSDRGNTRIQIFDQEGNFIDQWPNIIVPFDIAIDSDDNVWVCGYGPLRTHTDYHLPMTDEQLIMKFNPEGKLLLNWNFAHGMEVGNLDVVHGLALDSKGNVYTSEHGGRMQRFVKE